MKQILFISFYFPPTGIIGAIRSVKFVKYLQEFKVNPIILTCEEKTYGAKDFSLLNDIPKDVKIIRVPAFYMPNLIPRFKFLKINQIISFLSRNFFWPDPSIYWAKKAFLRSQELILQENIDTIFTTGGPFSSHLIGIWLKSIFPKIFWIADFRDEWTSNPFIKYMPLRKIYEKSLEKKVFYLADKIISISKEMKKSFIKFYPFSSTKIEIIYNGFDESDYKNLNFKDYENNSSIFQIAYAGSIYGLKKPDSLFKSLRLLLDENHLNIKVDFIGHNSYFIRKGIKKYKLKNIVNIKNRIPHNLLFSQLIKYDVLLLILGSGINAKRILTGKFFEYLRLKKPILALGPIDSEISDILKETDSGIIIDFNDIEKIKKTLIDLINMKKNGILYSNFKFIDEQINKYSRRILSRKLSEIIFNKQLS